MQDFPIKIAEDTIWSFKPDISRGYYYKDVLQYLVRVMPQNSPDYNFTLSLAAYVTDRGRLSDKQIARAEEIIELYSQKGFL